MKLQERWDETNLNFRACYAQSAIHLVSFADLNMFQTGLSSNKRVLSGRYSLFLKWPADGAKFYVVDFHHINDYSFMVIYTHVKNQSQILVCCGLLVEIYHNIAKLIPGKKGIRIVLFNDKLFKVGRFMHDSFIFPFLFTQILSVSQVCNIQEVNYAVHENI